MGGRAQICEGFGLPSGKPGVQIESKHQTTLGFLGFPDQKTPRFGHLDLEKCELFSARA